MHINKMIKYPAFILCLLASNMALAAKAPDLSGKYKASGPIEITSDSLEVLQQENKAIFNGHVVAVQGDVHLKSEKMTVFYKSNEKTGKKEEKAASPLTESVGEKNSIDKIIVEKNVFLSTPQETASGANGIYDVAGQKIFLNDNVVLTRDKNVLKGDRLVYDFASGKSQLNGQEQGKSSKRVKALFVPDEEKKNKK